MNAKICLLGLLFLALAGCQRVELKEFSPDGAFKVLFPEKREKKEQDFAGTPGTVWNAEFDDGALFLGVADLPTGRKLSDAEAQRLLKANVDQNVKEAGAELVSQSEVKLGDYPGLQYEAKVKIPKKAGGEIEGLTRRRIYLADGRMFILQALGRSEWVNTPEVSRFLESLQVSK